jgi:cation transport ATPase
VIIAPSNPDIPPADTPGSSPRHSVRVLWFHFIAGLAWAAALADLLSVCTNRSFCFTFAAVLGGFFVYGVGLSWLALWATRKGTRKRQFSINSLLVLTVVAAVFFGAVRWIVDNTMRLSRGPDRVEWFCVAALICALLAFLSLPLVLRMAEAAIWTAVWFIKRPWLVGRIRRWTKRGRGPVAGEGE